MAWEDDLELEKVISVGLWLSHVIHGDYCVKTEESMPKEVQGLVDGQGGNDDDSLHIH